MVLCPNCNQNTGDHEFCDHCNRELDNVAPSAPSLPLAVTLPSGELLDCSAWKGKWPNDPLQSILVARGGKKFRLHGLNPTSWESLSGTIERRARINLDVLPPVTVLTVDRGAVVAAEAWPNGDTDQAPVKTGVQQPEEIARLDQLVESCRALNSVIRPLHEAGFIWLNFDPTQIEVQSGQLRITNLDLTLFPLHECPDRLRVSRQFSPPEVCHFRPVKIGFTTDVFHLSIYAYYQLAGLLPHGFPGNGLESFDFEIPPLRIYRPNLPPGISPVIERGLAADATKRFPSTDAFLHDLVLAVDAAKMKFQSHWHRKVDVGGTTRAGRAKSALGTPNQDALAMVEVGREGGSQNQTGEGISSAIPGSSRKPGNQVLSRLSSRKLWNRFLQFFRGLRRLSPGIAGISWHLMVADGVSRARVGRGELASQTACQVLTRTIPEIAQAASDTKALESKLRDSCIAASKEIVRIALQENAVPEDVRDNDVMSTTAVIGCLNEGVLHLANIGDSRAYLIAGSQAEQLTVDGDVRCALLASGVPPEQVREMGVEAKSLRFCLGASREESNGDLVCDVQRSTPQITHWPLQPGDVVILCSDGLIEENVFLEPGDAARIAMEKKELSAQLLAENLVDAADSRQREPTPAEPEGFGDNICCIVIKVLPSEPETTKET